MDREREGEIKKRESELEKVCVFGGGGGRKLPPT